MNLMSVTVTGGMKTPVQREFIARIIWHMRDPITFTNFTVEGRVSSKTFAEQLN